MKIPTTPSGADLDALLAEHGHRFPETARVPVVDDGDEDVLLPILLGSPSGACRMPEDEKPSKAWRNMLAGGADDINEQLARDCVLWPERATWNAWCVRWPLLADAVGTMVAHILADVQLSKPSIDDVAPPAIEKALTSKPHAVWRQLQVRGEKFLLVIAPPDAAAVELYHEAFNATGADRWKVALEAVNARVAACERDGDGQAMSIAEVVARWPGVAFPIVNEANRLAGARAEVLLGKW